MVLQPIKRVVIHEAIIEQIKEYIEKENIKPGDKLLSERKLAERLQVSRNSVREALITLASHDIIDIRHGGGTFLKTKDIFVVSKHNNTFMQILKTLNDLISAREMMEVYSAKSAAKIITPEQIAWLYEVVEDDKTLSAKASAMEQMSDYLPNLRIELAITSILQNQLLTDMHKKIEGMWKQCWNSANSTPFTLETRYNEHKDIVKAIEKGSQKAIETVVIAHLQSIKTIVAKYIHEE